MNVAPLFVVNTNKTVQFQHMRLDMEELNDGYIWLLEINSNKFYVKFGINDDGLIGEFEVYGIKGFIEFNVRIIKILRNIVQNLTQLV